jgi:hypothetical protein
MKIIGWKCSMVSSVSCLVAAIVYAMTNVPVLTRAEFVEFHILLAAIFLVPVAEHWLEHGGMK